MHPRRTRRWTDLGAVEAVRQWAAGHGGHPPQTVDFASDPTLPSRTYVLRHFGGLASLRVRAGLAPGASGHGGRRRPPCEGESQGSESQRRFRKGHLAPEKHPGHGASPVTAHAGERMNISREEAGS
jgi:hypothetical protein